MIQVKYRQEKQTAKQFISIMYNLGYLDDRDLWTHYSVELMFINVAIGTFYRPFSIWEGRWSVLWPRVCMFPEIFGLFDVNVLTDINCW